jgi:hypothetical protein
MGVLANSILRNLALSSHSYPELTLIRIIEHKLYYPTQGLWSERLKAQRLAASLLSGRYILRAITLEAKKDGRGSGTHAPRAN